MRRVLICAALLAILAVGPIPADTVMLHIYADTSEKYFDDEDAMELVSAVEDGIMFEMFEAGHIVFNTIDRSTRLDTDDAAASGEDEGADWFMNVTLAVDRNDESFVLESLDYQAVDVGAEASHFERELGTDRLERREDESADEAARRVGAEVGADILEDL